MENFHSDMGPDGIITLEAHLLYCMLSETYKYEENFEALKAFLLSQRGRFLSFSPIPTFYSFLHMCMDQLGIQSFIVNIDEASKTTESILEQILNLFSQAILRYKIPIYFTITALYKETISKAISSSMMQRKDIYLSPLGMNHMNDIFANFGVQVITNTEFQYLLYLSGGVPRYVHYLLQILSTNSRITSIKDDSKFVIFSTANELKLDEYVQNLDKSKRIMVLDAWCAMIGNRLVDHIAVATATSILYLCLSEMSIDPNKYSLINLETEATSRFTIRDALLQNIVGRIKGDKLSAPLIILLKLHLASDRSSGFINSLQNLCGIMTPRDNESLYLEVLRIRLHVYKLLMVPTLKLSTLLGVKLSIINDFDVDVGLMTLISRCKARVEFHNFAELFDSNTCQPYVGYINSSGASFADAFVRLLVTSPKESSPTYIDILIQEKQSVMSRDERVNGDRHIAGQTFTSESMKREYDKLGELPGEKIFIYISDEKAI
jgi:hypothetical protein